MCKSDFRGCETFRLTKNDCVFKRFIEILTAYDQAKFASTFLSNQQIARSLSISRNTYLFQKASFVVAFVVVVPLEVNALVVEQPMVRNVLFFLSHFVSNVSSINWARMLQPIKEIYICFVFLGYFVFFFVLD